MNLIGYVAWFGSFTGLLGSLLLALNSPVSGWGFVVFLASNVAWLFYGWRTKTWSMCIMQIGFTFTSLLGIYRWIL